MEVQSHMSNAKRFLSVILAIVMMCSTLVIGANAAYTAYKDSAIIDQYNKLDKAVLTTDQYASAAMDEIDRMLTKEQLKFTREDIIVGDIDLTSIDAAMDSVYAIVNGALFSSLKGMLGDLQNLNADAFATEAKGGVRRGTAGKTDAGNHDRRRKDLSAVHCSTGAGGGGSLWRHSYRDRQYLKGMYSAAPRRRYHLFLQEPGEP